MSNLNLFTLTPAQYADFLKDFWENNPEEVALVHGLSGIGKSEIAQGVAKKMFGDEGWADVRLATKEAPDLVGAMVPDAASQTTVYFPPDDMPYTSVPNFQDKGVLALDEIRQGTPSVLNASYSLVYDRFVGKHHIRDGWRIMGMCNTADEMTFQERLPEPLRARLCHIHLQANTDDYIAHYMRSMPGETTVPAFLSFEPGAFHSHDSEGEFGFPCPRTWSRAGKSMKTGGDFHRHKIAGYIGQETAARFLKFIDIIISENNKISAREALLNPEKLTLDPRQNELAWAHASRISSYVIQEINKGNGPEVVPLMIKCFTHKSWTGSVKEIGRIGLSLIRTGCEDREEYNRILMSDRKSIQLFIKAYGDMADVNAR